MAAGLFTVPRNWTLIVRLVSTAPSSALAATTPVRPPKPVSSQSTS